MLSYVKIWPLVRGGRYFSMSKIKSLHLVHHGDRRCVLKGWKSRSSQAYTYCLTQDEGRLHPNVYSINLEGRDLESCAYFQAPSCVPVDQLNWTNELHPKFPVNNNGHTPLSLQSYVSDVIIYNPLVRQVHVYTFST
jgi:hypothetical protein